MNPVSVNDDTCAQQEAFCPVTFTSAIGAAARSSMFKMSAPTLASETRMLRTESANLDQNDKDYRWT